MHSRIGIVVLEGTALDTMPTPLDRLFFVQIIFISDKLLSLSETNSSSYDISAAKVENPAEVRFMYLYRTEIPPPSSKGL